MDQSSVGTFKEDVWISRTHDQRVLIGMDPVRLQVGSCSPRNISEGAVVVVGIGISRGCRQQDATRVGDAPILTVLERSIHIDHVWVSPGGGDANVVPALSGAEIESGIFWVGRVVAGERDPAYVG